MESIRLIDRPSDGVHSIIFYSDFFSQLEANGAILTIEQRMNTMPLNHFSSDSSIGDSTFNRSPGSLNHLTANQAS